jgi:hypothetical protein
MKKMSEKLRQFADDHYDMVIENTMRAARIAARTQVNNQVAATQAKGLQLPTPNQTQQQQASVGEGQAAMAGASMGGTQSMSQQASQLAQPEQMAQMGQI